MEAIISNALYQSIALYQQTGNVIRPSILPYLQYVCHMKTNIKYSPKKMWYIAVMVRGLQIDEAINQLRVLPKKGAVVVREALEEAKEMAVKEQNVEYGTNLWVCKYGIVGSIFAF